MDVLSDLVYTNKNVSMLFHHIHILSARSEKVKRTNINRTSIAIHNLLKILKTYYANTNQGKGKTPETEAADRLKIVLDTRKALGKRTEREDRGQKETGREILLARAKGDRKRDTPRRNYSEKEIGTEILPCANYSDTHTLPRVHYSETTSQEVKRPLNLNLPSPK